MTASFVEGQIGSLCFDGQDVLAGDVSQLVFRIALIVEL